MTRAHQPHSLHVIQRFSFERERLLNLIDSKIRRKEMTCARELAEELFRREVEFAVFQKARKYLRFNRVILKLIIFCVGVLISSLISMVLNINPVTCLLVITCALGAVCSVIVINAVILKKLWKALRTMMEGYEGVRQIFIERVLEGIENRQGGDLSVNSLMSTLRS